MKHIPIIAICGILVLVSIMTSTVYMHKINERFDQIENKINQIDHRRNAQYGIIKNKITGKCGVK